MNDSNNNYRFKLHNILRQKSMLAIYNSGANFHINDLTNTYSKYVTGVIFPSTHCFSFIWCFFEAFGLYCLHNICTCCVFIFDSISVTTGGTSSQESNLSSRGQFYFLCILLRKLLLSCCHCWSSPFLCTAFFFIYSSFFMYYKVICRKTSVDVYR